MNATQEVPVDTKTTVKPPQHHAEIDRNAPAGSKNSLGEESIRDGRPNTDDSVIEAIDELDPAIPDQQIG
jgi:hypothetical protein